MLSQLAQVCQRYKQGSMLLRPSGTAYSAPSIWCMATWRLHLSTRSGGVQYCTPVSLPTVSRLTQCDMVVHCGGSALGMPIPIPPQTSQPGPGRRYLIRVDACIQNLHASCATPVTDRRYKVDRSRSVSCHGSRTAPFLARMHTRWSGGTEARGRASGLRLVS